MASLTWKWRDYWAWFNQIERSEDKAAAMKELIKDGWIKNLSAEIQAEVMQDAPLEILQAMKSLPNIFKTDAIMIIQHQLDKKYKKYNKPQLPKRRVGLTIMR